MGYMLFLSVSMTVLLEFWERLASDLVDSGQQESSPLWATSSNPLKPRMQQREGESDLGGPHHPRWEWGLLALYQGHTHRKS